MIVKLDIKKIGENILGFLMILCIAATAMSMYLSINRYNGIGSDSYIAHYSIYAKDINSSLNIESRECIAGHLASTTKERIGGQVEAGFEGILDFSNIVTGGWVGVTEANVVLNMEYPFWVTAEELVFFVEKCG